MPIQNLFTITVGTFILKYNNNFKKDISSLLKSELIIFYSRYCTLK